MASKKFNLEVKISVRIFYRKKQDKWVLEIFFEGDKKKEEIKKIFSSFEKALIRKRNILRLSTGTFLDRLEGFDA